MHSAAPNYYILDNEVLGELEAAIMQKELSFQKVPPHQHKTNKAKRVIQTFKAHLKSGFASLDLDFPMYEWDRLLHQSLLTLNLLSTSQKIPTYLHMHM
mmetsp:Transcript_4207/g.5850  ORF Transcript_4207/g.5850 Transcript_4207/m.5850 type:complete len:99 (-) Transcript_4207:622-918(-)